jgi:hypothetical protein
MPGKAPSLRHKTLRRIIISFVIASVIDKYARLQFPNHFVDGIIPPDWLNIPEETVYFSIIRT